MQRVLARAGDPEAMNDLLARHLPWLRQLVALRLRHRRRCGIEIDDIVQNSLLDAFRSLAAFRENEGPFRGWLAGIVRNNVRDAQRWLARQRRDPRRSRQRVDDPVDEGGNSGLACGDASPNQLAEGRELEQRIDRAVMSLSDTHREILVLRERSGLDYGEIAARLGLKNADTARALHHRALVKLEDAVGPLADS